MNRAVDFSVGLLMILGVACLAYLSVSFGRVNLFGQDRYPVKAVFSKVTGLKENTEVEMLGIKVGVVDSIHLENYQAHVRMLIDRDVTLPVDTQASIKTEGLLGEKFVSLSPGGLPDNIAKDGSGIIRETTPPMVLEDLIGKMVFGQAGEGGQ